jgi:Tol biopolymer transport system component
LTTTGENAEAYFSFDGAKLSFQSTGEYPCDQIYTMNIDGSDRKLLSTGTGRTTCSHFLPDGKSVVYASTHLGAKECPPVPGREEGYVWPSMTPTTSSK